MNKEFTPKPERWKGPLGGADAFVDKVMLSSNSEDFFIIKVGIHVARCRV